MSETHEVPQLPQPDPALRRLDRLVGTWTMEGNLGRLRGEEHPRRPAHQLLDDCGVQRVSDPSTQAQEPRGL